MKIIWMLLSLVSFPIHSAWAEEVRVLLFQTQNLKAFSLSTPGGWEVLDLNSHQRIAQGNPQNQLTIAVKDMQVRISGSGKPLIHGPICVRAHRFGSLLMLTTPKTSTRAYSGWLEIRSQGNLGLQIITHLSETDYLTAVTAAEMPALWPEEALKAQAVLSRTYLAKHRGRHATEHADVCDLTHCQVYPGWLQDHKALTAVQVTSNQILTYQGQVLDAVFHACCGGKTASADSTWPDQPPCPYLQSVSDVGPHGDFCHPAPDYTWDLSIACKQLGEILHANDPTLAADLHTLVIQKKDSSGRVFALTLVDRKGHEKTISGETFYRAWGRHGHWHQLKSTAFDVEQDGGRLRFQGKGLGHGVGLCQWGARGRALAGWRYEAILLHYFSGAGLGRQDQLNQQPVQSKSSER